MRIKRFIAPDMRAALRMVREEQGADAVILSNRPTPDGIEVVAATDYDEALVQQALRAAAPGLQTVRTPLPATAPEAVVPAAPAPSVEKPQARPAPQVQIPVPALATASAAAVTTRPSLATRARSVFRMGNDTPQAPTLAELVGTAEPSSHEAPAIAAEAPPSTARFDAMMAALAAPPAPAPMAPATGPASEDVIVQIASRSTGTAPAIATFPADGEAVAAADLVAQGTGSDRTAAEVASAPLASDDRASQPRASFGIASAPAATADDAPVHDRAVASARRTERLELSLVPKDEAAPETAELAAADAVTDAATPLRVVAGRDQDPAVTAMRDELSAMRQLIEREMGQFAIERLRGSPGRAAAYDRLLGYGCDEALAQSVAAKLDPTLDPSKVQGPMLAHLAQMLTVTRAEPIDEGGVFALLGPTGAGKTTTIAKLAASFASRHRARDVAMVTIDQERAGAREQLQAHGRRLGITVCEAEGPEGLGAALDQLSDYPLVLVDTAGYAARDRALLGQITWLRATRNVRCLLALPACAHPQDLNEVVRRYRMATPEAVVLTKLDETGRLGSALSVAIRNGLSLAYTTHGQGVPGHLEAADPSRLVLQLEKLRRAADNPLATEDRHAVA